MESLTQQNIKWANTAAVFSAIAGCGPDQVSRADIAEKTGLSLMTVGKVADRLVDLQVLTQSKEAHSSAGRRTRLVCCNPHRYSLVLDLTSLNFRMTLLDLNLHVLDETRYRYDDSMYCEENLLLFLKNLKTWMRIPTTPAVCIGIGVLLPGKYDEADDRVSSTRLPELIPLHLRTLIRAVFDDVPLLFAEDLHAAACSAVAFGEAQSVRLWLSLGNPVSGLLLTEHGPLYGAHGLAGRFGALTVASGLTLDDALAGLNDRRAMAEALAAALNGLIAAFDPAEILLESSRFSLDDEFMRALSASLVQSKSSAHAPVLTVSDDLLGHAMRGIAMMQREAWLRGLISEPPTE